MRISYDQAISQILEACSLLILLTEQAHEMESRGKASMLDYGLIHACASKIQTAAEQRREALARLQWKNEVDEMARDLEMISFRCAN